MSTIPAAIPSLILDRNARTRSVVAPKSTGGSVHFAIAVTRADGDALPRLVALPKFLFAPVAAVNQ